MRQKIFDDLVKKPGSTKKWIFIPLSLFFHALVIATVLVYPLMSTDFNPPPLKIISIVPVMPAPPTVPVGKRGSSGRKNTKNKPETQKPKPNKTFSGRLVTPVEIPTDIIEESISDFADGFGLGDGIEGAPEGDPNGVLGAPTIFGNTDEITNQPALRISNIQKPRVIKRVSPIYPRAALMARIQGTVVIEAATDIYGKVVKANIIKGHPLLKQAALQAVMQWVFEPYMFDGIPKPVIFSVFVHFNLQQ